jgi:hypothetical protein
MSNKQGPAFDLLDDHVRSTTSSEKLNVQRSRVVGPNEQQDLGKATSTWSI